MKIQRGQVITALVFFVGVVLSSGAIPCGGRALVFLGNVFTGASMGHALAQWREKGQP